MATKDITIGGTTYTGVPSIEVPKSGGGKAKFVDVTDTTAAAEDVASGKAFYSALGVLTQGAGGGGGGGATVTTFFDETVTFTAVPTQWGTNYEAEAHVATLPIDFPAYDPDIYYSHAYNSFLNCITPTNGGCKVIGQMLPDEEELLMVLSWIFCPISPPSDENCQVTLYPDGTLKFLAYNEWAQTPTRIQFQLVEI